MPKRIAVNQIHVRRDNKRVVVKPGDLFDFTDDELADMKRTDAATGYESVRPPINEGGADPVANARNAKAGKPAADDTEL